MLEQILDNYYDEDIMIADGFDKAVIGIDSRSMRLIYSVTKCIGILIERDEMTDEEAVEFFEYNVAGAYVGEQTPIFCEDGFIA
jgi:hypothetical protein